MTSRISLLILGQPPKSFLEQLAEIRPLADIQVALTESQAAALIPEAEALLILGHNGTWLKTLLGPAKKLKWIQAGSTGVEEVVFPGLEQHPVVLTNSRGAFASPLAEFVMFCVLHFAKAFATMERNRQACCWVDYPVQELCGQSIGIVGYGETGQTVARLADAFGLRVLATRRTLSPGLEKEGVEFIPAQRWHELLARSDYVVNALPLTVETLGKFGEAEFRAMKRTACFVNVGRGKTVQEQVLVRALKEGWIGAAGLDVYETEPLPPDNELYTLPNVILSPHCADQVASSGSRLAAIVMENMRLYAKGAPLRNVVDKRLGY